MVHISTTETPSSNPEARSCIEQDNASSHALYGPKYLKRAWGLGSISGTEYIG